jgi:superfamily II DNA/RNA helicase
MEVHHLTGKTVGTAVNEIGPFLPPLSTDSPNIPLTIIFVNDRSVGQLVFNYVCNVIPSHLKHQVYFMFVLKSYRGKSRILYETKIKARGILICTEIAALVRRSFYWLLILNLFNQGCDFPNCSRVIQFQVTDNLDTWMQRGGRGGRGLDELCRSTILVQPSIKKMLNGKGKQTLDEAFSKYLTTKGCLWDVIDEHYGNPVHESGCSLSS